MSKTLRMTARYPGTCFKCDKHFPAGARIDFTKGATTGRKTAHAGCEEMNAYERAGAGLDYDEHDSAVGHGPGCFGECDGEWDCTAPA